MPRLRGILEGLHAGSLSLDLYPFVDGDDDEPLGADHFGGHEPSVALPRTELVGSWAFWHRDRGGAAAADDPAVPHDQPPKLMVLILGGASHAELHCATASGVAFGCTALLTPLQYLRALQELGHSERAPQPDGPGLLHFGD